MYKCLCSNTASVRPLVDIGTYEPFPMFDDKTRGTVVTMFSHDPM